jgi:proteasome lid subunit RPN8/RPN11
MDEIRIGPTQSLSPPEERAPWHDQWTGARPPVAIRLGEEALRAIDAHASATLDEVGGLLIGEVFSWEGTLYVDIRVALSGERTQAGPTHVTFTADTWAALLRRQEREYPGLWVVGWYHSHPRMSVFLSDMDLGLHRGFFSQPWHVALVINAQDRLMSVFSWSGGNIRPVREFIWTREPSAGSEVPITVQEEPETASPIEPATEETGLPARGKARGSLWAWSLALIASALMLAYWRSRKANDVEQKDAET